MVMDEEKESYRYYRVLHYYPGYHLQVNHLSLNCLMEPTGESVIAPGFDPQGHRHIAGESRAVALLKTCQAKKITVFDSNLHLEKRPYLGS